MEWIIRNIFENKGFEINGKTEIHDAEKFPYPYENNFFDLVYSKSFIEHFYYTDKILEEIYRIIKPGGKNNNSNTQLETYV